MFQLFLTLMYSEKLNSQPSVLSPLLHKIGNPWLVFLQIIEEIFMYITTKWIHGPIFFLFYTKVACYKRSKPCFFLGSSISYDNDNDVHGTIYLMLLLISYEGGIFRMIWGWWWQWLIFIKHLYTRCSQVFMCINLFGRHDHIMKYTATIITPSLQVEEPRHREAKDHDQVFKGS